MVEVSVDGLSARGGGSASWVGGGLVDVRFVESNFGGNGEVVIGDGV